MTKILFPNEEVFDGKYFNIHQDWEVPIPWFFILASKRKLKSIWEFSLEEQEEFINLLCKLRRVMKEVLKIETVYFFQNEDTSWNFHFWIFPRYKCMDEKFWIKVESVRPIMNYAKENMVNDVITKEVKINVNIMKEYMKSSLFDNFN